MVGLAKPKNSAMLLPISLTPSITDCAADFMPSPRDIIRFLPQLNASLIRFDIKFLMSLNTPVTADHIFEQKSVIPFHMLLKKPAIASPIFINIASRSTPSCKKKPVMPSIKPYSNYIILSISVQRSQ